MTLNTLRRQSFLLYRRTLRTLASATATFNHAVVDRPADDVDVCIVGAGPAGLSAAIRLKQLVNVHGNQLRVVILEKGPDVGAHILSGAVFEPRALDELLPNWRSLSDHPFVQPSTSSSMRFLTPSYAIPIPHPPQMSNDGNYVLSLSVLTRWLASIAENEYGVEIYPGFAGSRFLLSNTPDAIDQCGNLVKSIRGVITNEVGLSKHFVPKSNFEPGMAFNAKVTLLAEGAHGSLSKLAMQMYQLRKHSQPQTYGIGLKEVWRIDQTLHEPGKVVHTIGWPLDISTYGGGFLYHMDDGLASLGLVIGLDYKNPYLSPYHEFQRIKHHPFFRSILASGERLAYGARVLNEGGLQSIPKLDFPGGALIGCSAGFVNVAKIKGIHNAMKSGMLAAEAAYDAIHPPEQKSSSPQAATDMSKYETALRSSWVWEDLYEVRNLRPSFNTSLGIWGGMAYSGIDSLLKGRVPWTFNHAPLEKLSKYMDGKSLDAAHTENSSQHQPIDYPAFEPPLSTDLMTSVSLTGTTHTEDQPVHLRVVKTSQFLRELDVGEFEQAEIGAVLTDPKCVVMANRKRDRQRHVEVNLKEYAGLLGRACPAGVYEYVEAEANDEEAREEGWDGKKLVVNSQNCIHCKLCDVKVPTQDITWTTPEGGDGPKYTIT